jgi:P27 family predicted phage terminase small subunit
MRGRKPTPTALKLLRNNPGRRPLNPHEPKPPAVRSAPPAWLTGAAATEWRRIAPELSRLGLLTTIDRDALAAYCQTFARWREAEAEIKKRGMVLKGRDGGPVKSPFITIADRALAQLLRYQEQFGMTPSARSRVSTTTTDKPADPFARYDDDNGPAIIERWK